MQQSPATVPNLDPVVHSQSRTQSSGEDRLSVSTPFTPTRVRRGDLGDLVQSPTVKDVDLSCQVTKAGEKDQAALWVERDRVPRMCAEVGRDFDALIEENRSGRHIFSYRPGSAFERLPRTMARRRKTHSRK